MFTLRTICVCAAALGGCVRSVDEVGTHRNVDRTYDSRTLTDSGATPQAMQTLEAGGAGVAAPGSVAASAIAASPDASVASVPFDAPVSVPPDASVSVPPDASVAGLRAPWTFTCGDGSVDSSETCDDGNTNDGDGCTAECCLEIYFGVTCSNGWHSEHRAPCHCGDAFLESPEECDDGDTRPGDGCGVYCKIEIGICGNGELEPDEECDDGNLERYDGCDPGCRSEFKCSAPLPVPGASPDAGLESVRGMSEDGGRP